jgi:CRP/FNR family transcriptional regulator, cyclic AMP receptor protein
MSARIVHFGNDRFNRLGSLRDAGYSIDACNTLEEFRVAVRSGLPVDALTIAEAEGAPLDDALAIARSGSQAPLIFFQGSTHRRHRSEFNLVVPLLARPGAWLAEIGELIAQDRAQRGVTDEHSTAASPPGKENPEMHIKLGSPRSRESAALLRPKRPNGRAPEALTFNWEQVSLQSQPGQFLKALTPEMLRELESIMTVSFCAPGTVLFVEGQTPHEVFLLLEGQVKVFMNAHDGRRLTVHIAGSGEILGLASAFTSSLHRASAETLYPSRLACVPCTDLLKFLAIHPKASQAAARELSESCDRTYTRLRTIGVTPSNRAKLARLLLEWASQGKSTDRGIQIHVALKHGEIAECIGTCRESITRIMRDLQRWNVIELHGSLLTITDMPALEQCAERS